MLVGVGLPLYNKNSLDCLDPTCIEVGELNFQFGYMA